jgi:hypothetical protein
MQQRFGFVSMVALSSFLLLGAGSPASCKNEQIGPSTGEVVGIAVGIGAVVVGTVVLIEVHESHKHNIKGCVTAGPSGLEVHNEQDDKTYALIGGSPNVKVGDIIKVHGKKEKGLKDDGAREFMVDKMSRDYGPCKVAATSASTH